MGTHHPIRKTVIRTAATPEIPDKLYFRIGDVARLCEVPAYVLRFWETEFPQLKPHKGGTGQRLYRKRDVETALRVRALLYDEGYTIPGARQVLKTEARPAESKPLPLSREPMALVPNPAAEPAGPTLAGMRRDARLRQVRAEMAHLLATLSKPPADSSKDQKVQPMQSRHAAESARSRQLSLDGELF